MSGIWPLMGRVNDKTGLHALGGGGVVTASRHEQGCGDFRPGDNSGVDVSCCSGINGISPNMFPTLEGCLTRRLRSQCIMRGLNCYYFVKVIFGNGNNVKNVRVIFTPRQKCCETKSRSLPLLSRINSMAANLGGPP